MKLFVVLFSVAVVIMFVFATDAAAAPTDNEETNDMISLTAPVGGVSPYVRFSSSDSNKKSMSPLLDLLKTVIKLMTKVFSFADVEVPIGSVARQHRGTLA